VDPPYEFPTPNVDTFPEFVEDGDVGSDAGTLYVSQSSETYFYDHTDDLFDPEWV